MFAQREVLEILACPKCKESLRTAERSANSANNEEDGLMCEKCKLLFPIRDGIPVMLIDEAIESGEK